MTSDPEKKAREDRAELERRIASLSLEELRSNLLEKSVYENGLRLRFAQLDAQHQRVSSEKSNLELKNGDLKKRNIHLEEQHDLHVAILKHVMATKKGDDTEWTVQLLGYLIDMFDLPSEHALRYWLRDVRDHNSQVILDAAYRTGVSNVKKPRKKR